MLLGQQRGSQGVPAGLPQADIRRSLGAELPEDEVWQMSQTFQAAEAAMGLMEHPELPLGFQTHAYLPDGRTLAGEHTTNLMLQQLQQGQAGLLQQLESTYRPRGSSFWSHFDSYQREDQHFKPETQHSPYPRDDPGTPWLSLSEQGFLCYSPEVPEPQPRDLAVQNAKAYLLQTSVSSDLSL